jgi:UDP-GlcNAc:undecaprenyl-phosphate/decaprenyl-phosphate GlcNAc-1-phosphate transferase
MIPSGVFLFFLAAGLAWVVAPVVIALYRSRGWVEEKQQIRAKRTHEQIVPRGGGLVVGIPLLILGWLALPASPLTTALLTAGVVLTVMGALDDIFDLHPIVRLLVGCGVASLVVLAGVSIPFVTHPWAEGVLHLDAWSWPLTLGGLTFTIQPLSQGLAVLFILWNMNIVNWSKGVDGQLPGYVAVAFFFIGLLALRFGDPTQHSTQALAFLLSGAFAGLLYWNFYPQKMMPGYGAGSLAGFFLAVLAILSGAKIATMLMVLAVPTADAIFTITRRVIAGKSPLWGDRGHLHHKLLDWYGWGRRRIALFYMGSTFVLGCISLVAGTTAKLVIIGTVFLFVFLFLIRVKLLSLTHETSRRRR